METRGAIAAICKSESKTETKLIIPIKTYHMPPPQDTNSSGLISQASSRQLSHHKYSNSFLQPPSSKESFRMNIDAITRDQNTCQISFAIPPFSPRQCSRPFSSRKRQMSTLNSMHCSNPTCAVILMLSTRTDIVIKASIRRDPDHNEKAENRSATGGSC